MPLDHLTLLVPDLLWPEPADHEVFDGLNAPTLEALLARGRCARQPRLTAEAALANIFGHPAPHAFAAWRLSGEAAPLATDDACWIAADPVHLRFHQERLLLADGSTLSISDEEAARLIDGLNRHFSDFGQFHAASPERWYLRASAACPLRQLDAPPRAAVAGRSIEKLLPDLMADRAVRGALNEIQTFLHAHPVNQQREASGQLPLNSLWLWGAGSLQPRRECVLDGVWSSDPLAVGLARAAGVPARGAPRDAATLLTHAAPATRHLAVLDALIAPVREEHGVAYRSALAALENDWFAPLRHALAQGTLSGLCLVAPTAYGTLCCDAGRRDHWRLWRRPQTLATLADTFAKDVS